MRKMQRKDEETPEPECSNEEGHNFEYVEGSSDSRQDWTEESYSCSHCGLIKTIRSYHDMYGTWAREVFYENI